MGTLCQRLQVLNLRERRLCASPNENQVLKGMVGFKLYHKRSRAGDGQNSYSNNNFGRRIKDESFLRLLVIKYKIRRRTVSRVRIRDKLYELNFTPFLVWITFYTKGCTRANTAQRFIETKQELSPSPCLLHTSECATYACTHAFPYTPFQPLLDDTVLCSSLERAKGESSDVKRHETLAFIFFEKKIENERAI